MNAHPEITAHMGAYILKRRRDLGLSLDAVAARIDCSKSYIWELEKGRSKNPTIWMILGLCEALQCSLDSMLGRDFAQPLFTDAEVALIDAHRRIYPTAKTERTEP